MLHAVAAPKPDDGVLRSWSHGKLRCKRRYHADLNLRFVEVSRLKLFEGLYLTLSRRPDHLSRENTHPPCVNTSGTKSSGLTRGVYQLIQAPLGPFSCLTLAHDTHWRKQMTQRIPSNFGRDRAMAWRHGHCYLSGVTQCIALLLVLRNQVGASGESRHASGVAVQLICEANILFVFLFWGSLSQNQKVRPGSKRLGPVCDTVFRRYPHFNTLVTWKTIQFPQQLIFGATTAKQPLRFAC